MELNTRKEQDVAVIAVKGRVDAVTAPQFEKHLSGLIEAGELFLLIDLSDLEYISSAGLRTILATAKRLKTIQGELLFAGLRGPVEEVFKISGFHTIFKVYETTTAALTRA
jgi:anti-anti-sigma factor